MSILQNMVDKTNVNYENIFSYSILVSFSEISQEITSGRVVSFIPSYIEYYIPEIDDPLITVNEEPVDAGTNIVFTFGEIGYSGYSTMLRIQCKYSFPATTTSFSNVTKLYINNSTTPVLAVTAPTVSLAVNGNFVVTKSVYIPTVNPAPGGYVIWKLVLSNQGDKGAPITNFTVSNTMPQFVTLAEGWPIIGNDTSNNTFSDKNFDGVVALNISADLKSFTFSLNGTYTGTEYTIIVIGMIATNASTNQYADSLTWSAATIAQTNTVSSLSIVKGLSTVNFDTQPPEFVKRGNYYSTIMVYENTGNVNMEDWVMSTDIPPEITPYKFYTGTFGIPEVSYFPALEYSVQFVFKNATNDIQYQTITGLKTDVNTIITASQIIVPPGYTLKTVQGIMPSFVPGMKSIINPETFAIVNDINPSTTTIQNHSHLQWTAAGVDYSVMANHATNINDNVSLIIIKSQIQDDLLADTIEHDGIIRYVATIECPQSYLYKPILVEYLPSQIRYIGHESYIYFNYETQTTYYSKDTSVPFPLPILHPTETSLAEGIRVVRFSYTGVNQFDLKQRDKLTIEFDAQVIDDDYESPSIENFMYLGNYGPDGSMGPEIENFPDTNLDYDGDGYTTESLAKSNSVYLTILSTPGFDATTKIKGSQNLNFVDGIIPIRSRSGDNVTFRLTLQNNRDKDLYNVEIIDILPYLNDSSTLNPLVPRGSQYTCGYVSVTASVAPIATEIVPTFSPKYSNGENPIRFDSNNNDIGLDEWVSSATTSTRAVKLTQNDVPFKIGQTLTVDITVSTPATKDPELIAYNTFAIRSSYNDDNGDTTLLTPIEPYKKGVRGIGAKSIEGIVFEDLNKTGVFNISDPGINNILVSIYDNNGQKIDDTVTHSLDNVDGYYVFNDLSDGVYYLLFTIDDRRYAFTKQILDNELGSKPNKYGFTPPIEINSQIIDQSVYAGLVDVTMRNVLAVNKQAEKTVRSALYANMLLDLKLNNLTEKLNLEKN